MKTFYRGIICKVLSSGCMFCSVFISNVFISNAEGNTCVTPATVVSEVHDMACVNDDLRTAMQSDDLIRKISSNNVFSSLHPKDLVRAVKTLSFFDRSLTHSIEDIHKAYQQSERDKYTFQITSYPAIVKENSCQKNKTIDFKMGSFEVAEQVSGRDAVFSIKADYSVVPERSPRAFQARVYKSRIVLCEHTDMSYNERIKAYCGRRNSKCVEDLKKIPLCSSVDQSASQDNNSTCISLDDFSDLSSNLLMYNSSLEYKYCPDGCSYYTQTVQEVYKKTEGSDEYCSDNYLIVHCGPKKDENEYNLNIREITNVCTDFEDDVCSSTY